MVWNMENTKKNGSSKLSLIGLITLFCFFTTTTSRQYEIQQEFVPWPLNANNRVCKTQECHDAAEQIKNSLNFSADPCDNFYEFACGKWISEHPVLPADPQRSPFNIVGDKVNDDIKEILESPIHENEPYSVKAAKKFYRACKDTDHLDEEGLVKLLEIINSLGGLPLATNHWSAEGFNWLKTVGKITKDIGTSPLITMYVYKDQRNSSRNVLINDQSSLSFPRVMLVEPKTYETQLDAYRKYVVAIVEELVIESNLVIATSKIEAEVDEMMNFEMKLAEITVPSEQRLDPYRKYNPKTLRELQSLTDSVDITNRYARIDWKLYLDILFAGTGITFSPDEIVIVNEVDFIPKLVKLLDETPLRVLANYINFKAVKQLASYTTQRMRDIGFEFASTFYGMEEQSPRWEQCVSTTREGFSMAIGYAYVKKRFNIETKEATRQMVENIRNQFVSSFDDIDWMDAPTKKVAKEKASEMEENIAYPDWFSNSSALAIYYDGISVEDDYISSVLSLTRVTNDFWLKKLRKPTDRKDWLTSPETVNAFYNPQDNNIIIPAGILQSPIFGTGRPVALNYGAMGAVVGHEITHGFDDTGRKSDKYGNLAQWWSQDTIDTYERKAKCFIEQYGNFRVPELDPFLQKEVKMSGIRTLGENIADNGGLRQAFIAYQKYIEKHGPEKVLPGVEEYSPEKLFFIGFAMVWCGTSTPQVTLQQVLTDSHSPGKFRVIGTLSNLEQFAEIWQCPAGSPMNPTNKCKIW